MTAMRPKTPPAGSRRPDRKADGEVRDLQAEVLPMDSAVTTYIRAIPSEHRALFGRIHRLILEACPGATVVLSYNMPTYQLGTRRLHVGAWKHGVSLYGWKAHGDGGFTARHPDLQASTGTIRLRPDTAIADNEVLDLARAALGSPQPASPS
jgi:uncharacterized protein YdhG (YjbR/CyaY superfamily)